jgi:Na+-translocating ferredoxin:NAD+ oxidoreductase RnfA subunit
MPRRRRVYVIRIEDLLADDPPPPSRLRPILRALAVTLGFIGLGVGLIELIAALFPAQAAQTVIPAAIGYSLIILLFISLAKRIHHIW